ncbi:unnamed protein product [Diamesa tonsa]
MKTCLIIIGWFLITVATTTVDPTKSCKWIYKCCEEVDGNCVRVCDSEIVCKDLVSNQNESLEEIVSTVTDSVLEVTTVNITKCCAHEKVNGEIQCIEMCQPEIKCDDDVPSDVESFISPVTAFQAFSVNIPSACRKGYRRDDDGICRRVFGFTTAANNRFYKYKK